MAKATFVIWIVGPELALKVLLRMETYKVDMPGRGFWP